MNPEETTTDAAMEPEVETPATEETPAEAEAPAEEAEEIVV